MITVVQAKEFLRIPYDSEDTMITSMINAGYSYLSVAIDDFDDLYQNDNNFVNQADDWVLRYWMPHAYDERSGGLQGNSGLNYMARSVLTQLQMYQKEETGNETED